MGPALAKIFLALRRTDSGSQPIALNSERFRDGWQYQVDLPEVVEQERYVRAIVNVLLLEMANRNAGDRSAEVPLWLSEGFSEQLLAEDGAEIILPPPDQSANGVTFKRLIINARRESPLKQAHEKLAARQPLSFEQLCWPSENQMSSEDAGVYRSSAQLFLNEIFRLDDGRPCLRAMLGQLPQFYNWQLAFLRAFRSHFQSTTDTEKWWALEAVRFTGSGLDLAWPLKESLEKLDEALLTPVAAPAETNGFSGEASMSLQAIIREWEWARQIPALRAKVREIELLRLRLARELVLLAEGYRRMIAGYVQDHGALAAGPESNKPPRLDQAAKDALKALDSLDKQREALRSLDKPVAAAQLSAGPDAPH